MTDPFAAALRLLTSRERSSAELRERLRRKGFAETSIAATLERCRDLGYLDDARFARVRVRSLLSSGRAVGEKIIFDLRARGIPEGLARAALAEAGGATVESELLRRELLRRFPGFSFADADQRQQRRVIHYFLRRGFPLSRVLDILHGREVD